MEPLRDDTLGEIVEAGRADGGSTHDVENTFRGLLVGLLAGAAVWMVVLLALSVLV